MKTPEHKELDFDKYGFVGAVFIAQDILERAELVAEYFEEKGDTKKAEQVRSLVCGEHALK